MAAAGGSHGSLRYGAWRSPPPGPRPPRRAARRRPPALPPQEAEVVDQGRVSSVQWNGRELAHTTWDFGLGV